MASTRRPLREFAVKKLGVTEDEVHRRGTVFGDGSFQRVTQECKRLSMTSEEGDPRSEERDESDLRSKEERLAGYTTEALARDHAVKKLGVSEDEVHRRGTVFSGEEQEKLREACEGMKTNLGEAAVRPALPEQDEEPAAGAPDEPDAPAPDMCLVDVQIDLEGHLLQPGTAPL